MDRGLSLTEYSGALKPKTGLGISAFCQDNRAKDSRMIPWRFTYLCWNIPRFVSRKTEGFEPVIRLEEIVEGEEAE